MRFFERLGPRCGKMLIVGIVCALSGGTAGTYAQAKKQPVVTPSRDARFAPVDPARPEGTQVAVLSGDPANGPSAIIIKRKKGEGRMHIHSSDYHGVLLQGMVKHWSEGEEEKDAKLLGPGSYWFQPGGQGHADACLSDECLIFVKWEGKMDGRLIEAPKQ